MTLRQKVYNLFDVFIPDGTSDKAVITELNRRGKFDLKKAFEIIFLLLERIEELEEIKDLKLKEKK